jgi:hypothetical protein
MRKGELIDSDKYKDMLINRPIPWIGMPVNYLGEWYLVDNMVDGFARITTGAILNSYRREKVGHRAAFVLPGEPNAPSMSQDFKSKISSAYPWGISVKCVNGVWVRTNMVSNTSEFLYLPCGCKISDVFPNNGTESFDDTMSSTELKKLNTDGRHNCASCNGLLKQIWFGNTNLSYCPSCE